MPQNCLLITIDSLRTDHLAAFGYKSNRTPAIDGLVNDGVSFNKAFATGPGTSPSFPAVLTGTLALSHGGLGPLRSDRPRLSEHLSASGLTTAGIQSNPFLSAQFNYDKGFDYFNDYQNPLMGVATRVFPRGIELSNPTLQRIDDVFGLTDIIKKSYQLVKGKPRPYVSADVITDDTLDWLDRTDGSFFCWSHYMDVHHPCFPPTECRERHDVGHVTQSTVQEWYSTLIREPESLSDDDLEALVRLYDAAIEYVDEQIGRIVDQLKTEGRYDDTLIVLTSDHGELFGEHGEYGKPFRMYDELLHVPLIVVNGQQEIEDATDDLVSLVDVPPLVHETLGIDVPHDYEGRCPGLDTPRSHILAEHEVDGDVIVGARSDGWLYEGDEIEGERRLFAIEDGSVERVTADTDDPGAAGVRRVVLSRLETLDVDAHSLEDEITGDVQDRLGDLGYL